jgi:hypothetical protein
MHLRYDDFKAVMTHEITHDFQAQRADKAQLHGSVQPEGGAAQLFL